MSKRLRYLRIAFSLVCGICCLLMIAWWVRGYWWADGGFLKLTPSKHIQFHAGGGRMTVYFEHNPSNRWFESWSQPVTELPSPDAEDRIPWFALHFWPTFARLYIAHWIIAVLAGLLAVVPWCPTRFSLRTLLVGTATIAAIVGVIVWVDKTF